MKTRNRGPTEEQSALATRVFQVEGTGEPGDAVGPRVFLRAGEYFSRIFGSQGFQALLSRALLLARADSRVLEGVEIGPDGTLEIAPGQPHPEQGPGELNEGLRALLTHLIALLEGFIGLDLARRLLVEVWPVLGGQGGASGQGAPET